MSILERVKQRKPRIRFEVGYATLGLKEDHVETIEAVSWETALERAKLFSIAHMMWLVRIEAKEFV